MNPLHSPFFLSNDRAQEFDNQLCCSRDLHKQSWARMIGIYGFELRMASNSKENGSGNQIHKDDFPFGWEEKSRDLHSLG